MATTFPQTTYPLDGDATIFYPDNYVIVDRLDDGTVRGRELSTSEHAMINCVFAPMDEATSDAFRDYLATNKSTEFDFTFSFDTPDVTWRGLIDSRSVKFLVNQGTLHMWSFNFYGTKQ